MTHFNHEWDTGKTPAVPVSVGDRYYAQDLNDDFNYLKHLPYEVFLQGRSRGVMVAPNDTWDNDTDVLTLSGGFGAVLQDCIELDPDEDFVIPPKTHSSPRYERIPFADTVLALPNDGAVHYIVATPTKRSLLQRVRALFAEQYASRIRYDGVITIQDTAPTAGQILVGLCRDKEYCLLIDSNSDQCKDSIILKKWFGQNKITQYFVPVLQTYYDTSISSIETKVFVESGDSGVSFGALIFNNCTISINTVSNRGIHSGTFNNCTISINTVNGDGIYSGDFNSCNITINSVGGGKGISNGIFNNCTISFDTISGNSKAISTGIFNTCIISIDTISSGTGINVGIFNTCIISIDTMSSGNIGINDGTFDNCTISFSTVNGANINDGTFNNCIISFDNPINNVGIANGTFNNCTISFDNSIKSYGIGDGTFNDCNISIYSVNDSSSFGIYRGTFNSCIISIGAVSGGTGVRNNSSVVLYLTRVICSSISSLSSTSGKVNVLNSAVLHMS